MDNVCLSHADINPSTREVRRTRRRQLVKKVSETAERGKYNRGEGRRGKGDRSGRMEGGKEEDRKGTRKREKEKGQMTGSKRG